MKEKNECLIKYKDEIRALLVIQKNQVTQIAEIQKEVSKNENKINDKTNELNNKTKKLSEVEQETQNMSQAMSK